MKKVLGINGGPRKNRNTAKMLESALEGAAEAGAETSLIHLYDLKYSGCVSCFACKRLKNNAEICVIKDDLRPLLEEAMRADAVIMGSPIYFSDVTAALRAFLERLLFMNLTYDMKAPSKFKGGIATGLVYTMNVPAQMMERAGYNWLFQREAGSLSRLLNGPSEFVFACDTSQYDDYSKYMSSMFDPAHKERVRREVFPGDLLAARELGARLAGGQGAGK